jgi:hypothetical protein
VIEVGPVLAQARDILGQMAVAIFAAASVAIWRAWRFWPGPSPLRANAAIMMRSSCACWAPDRGNCWGWFWPNS